MIMTTICYLQKDGKTLFMHRIKKKNDINEGKWIGVGGKFEPGEDPETCVTREVYEETGYVIDKLNFVGFVTFPGIVNGEDEGMFLFTSDCFHGSFKPSVDEGQLEWIPDEKIPQLNLWEGDRYFFDWFKQDRKVLACFTYANDQLVQKKIHFY